MIRASMLVLSLVLAAGTAHSQSQPSRLKKIASAGAITIAYRADATPFSFLDETKQIGGFSIDLCKRVVALMGNQLTTKAPLQIKWFPVTSQTRMEAVAKGQADMECGSTTVTLAQIYRSGEIREIFGRWFGRFGEPTVFTKAIYILGSIPD